MIIAGKFENDKWLELQWAQHDVYHDALGVLVRENKRNYESAVFLTNVQDDSIYDSLVTLGNRIDHRTMQNAHDHLAAVWRSRSRFTQPDLFLRDSVEDLAQGWLKWLQQEVSLWPRDFPHLVRMVCLVIVQQNVKSGYDAEDALQKELERIYPLGDA
jgi:hypothetical protein